MLSKRISYHTGNVAFALLVTAALPTTAAHAYLDAGSVTMALQVIVGSVASGLMFGKLYLNRLRGFFRRGGKTAND